MKVAVLSAAALLLFLSPVVVEGFVAPAAIRPSAAKSGASTAAATSLNLKVESAVSTEEEKDDRPLLDWLPPKINCTAVLFDCDGVLAETERDAHRVAFNKAFEHYKGVMSGESYTWSVEVYGVLLKVGGGKERIKAFWDKAGWPDLFGLKDVVTDYTTLEELRALAREAESSAKGGDIDTAAANEFVDECMREFQVTNPENTLVREILIRLIHKKKTQFFNDIIDAGDVDLRPGVERLIDSLLEKRDVAVAVCSTSSKDAVSNLVEKLIGPDKSKRIRVFAGDDVRNKKPAPDIYLLALKELGYGVEDEYGLIDKDLPSREQVIVVEDSLIGLNSANAAGLKCIVTKSVYTQDENFIAADLTLQNLNSLRDVKSGEVTLDTIEYLLNQKRYSSNMD